MKNLLIIFLVYFSFSLFGAEPIGNIYWIQLNTKTGTPYRINKPELYLSQRAIERRTRHNIEIDSTDLPINPDFIDSLRSLGFYIKHTSRWINGVIAIYPDMLSIDSLKLPSFVSSIELRKGLLKSLSTKLDEPDSLTKSYYGTAAEQITMLNGHLLHKYSKGEGIHIAVIDAGFQNANNIRAFDSLYAREGILGTFDFANPGNSVYTGHSHGTNVLSIMAANLPGTLIGTAPNANYWLLRSEVDPGENPIEEDYWVIAAEFADSVGCDVINTSLGYTNFDNSNFNHNYGEFTGDSLRISKAANLAVKKGVVVVCSAGNEGSNPWHHIVAPSEARDVISVAASNMVNEIAYFSSRGFDDTIHLPKPDVTALGAGTAIIETNGSNTRGSGTSFSGPVIAGMAACLVGLFPDSSAYSIIAMIRKAGHLYPEHSVDWGYGIPDFGIYLPDEPEDTTSASSTNLTNNIYVSPNPFINYIKISNPEKVDKVEIVAFDGKRMLLAMKGEPLLYGIPSDKISKIPKGIYIIRIWSEDSVQTLKLIKK